MFKPVLSVIIISFNTSELTQNCLKSVFADKGLTFDLKNPDSTSKTPTEIIVIDNNSVDDSVAAIKKNFPQVTLIANSKNTGFGQANNQAFQIAQGNYFLLLNSDTLILHSAISQSLDWLCSHPESLGCTAQLLNKDLTIQASGGYIPNLLNVATWCLGLDDLPFINRLVPPIHPHTPDFYTKDRYFLSDHPQDWLTGAFLLIRAPAIKKVAGFDPNYFMYGEELEMCFRLSKTYPKNKFWYLIGPQIIHLGGASSKSKQAIFDREYEGILSFFKKHRSPLSYQIATVLIKINRLLRLTVYRLFFHHV